jgi:hypothetical protein
MKHQTEDTIRQAEPPTFQVLPAGGSWAPDRPGRGRLSDSAGNELRAVLDGARLVLGSIHLADLEYLG